MVSSMVLTQISIQHQRHNTLKNELHFTMITNVPCEMTEYQQSKNSFKRTLEGL